MYQITTTGLVIRVSDGAHIPQDEGNADYREYLNWVEEGNTPTALTEASTAADVDALRAAAYRTDSDPLFFKYQRGEATKEEWLASIEDIKARYPKTE